MEANNMLIRGWKCWLQETASFRILNSDYPISSSCYCCSEKEYVLKFKTMNQTKILQWDDWTTNKKKQNKKVVSFISVLFFWKFVNMYLFWIIVHWIRIRKTIPEQVARSQTDTVFVEVYAKCITTVNIQHIKTWILNHNVP